jgi:hypothetical protein
MSCAYEKYIGMGGVSGTLSGARAADLLRLHRQHCESGSTCPASPAPKPGLCRICGAADCDKVAHFRLALFRAALAFHDDSPSVNGHGRLKQ